MNNIEPDYNYQVTTGGRSIGETFIQNRIRQAYKSGLDDGFIQKQKLIKYLEEEISNHKLESHFLDEIHDEKKIIKNCTELLILEDILEKVKSGKYE